MDILGVSTPQEGVNSPYHRLIGIGLVLAGLCMGACTWGDLPYRLPLTGGSLLVRLDLELAWRWARDLI